MIQVVRCYIENLKNGVQGLRTTIWALIVLIWQIRYDAKIFVSFQTHYRNAGSKSPPQNKWSFKILNHKIRFNQWSQIVLFMSNPTKTINFRYYASLVISLRVTTTKPPLPTLQITKTHSSPTLIHWSQILHWPSIDIDWGYGKQTTNTCC